MIKLTERAATQVKAAVESQSLPEKTMLRVDFQPQQGKEEPRLALKLDPNEPAADDMVEATGNMRVAVKKTLANALGDGKLDFREDVGGFVFERTEPAK